jgi:hypothetical protein
MERGNRKAVEDGIAVFILDSNPALTDITEGTDFVFRVIAIRCLLGVTTVKPQIFIVISVCTLQMRPELLFYGKGTVNDKAGCCQLLSPVLNQLPPNTHTLAGWGLAYMDYSQHEFIQGGDVW